MLMGRALGLLTLPNGGAYTHPQQMRTCTRTPPTSMYFAVREFRCESASAVVSARSHLEHSLQRHREVTRRPHQPAVLMIRGRSAGRRVKTAWGPPRRPGLSAREPSIDEDMVVLKFGGTSVGEIESIRRVVEIVAAERRARAVIVSALAGVTDALLQLAARHHPSAHNTRAGDPGHHPSAHNTRAGDPGAPPQRAQHAAGDPGRGTIPDSGAPRARRAPSAARRRGADGAQSSGAHRSRT